MRRPVSMLGLLLALGLCTSVLIAWAGALVDRAAWPDTPLTRNPTGTRTEMRGWLVEQGRDATLTWRTFDALDLWDAPPDLDAPTTLPAWSVGHALPDQPGPFAPARERTMDVAWEVSAGWPLRCVRAVRVAGPAEFALPGEFVRGGLAAMAFGWPVPADAVAGHERPAVDPWPSGGLAAVVPLRPMVGGMAVNTIAYALAWGVLLSPLVALRAVRRRQRSKKNRCVACGHARDGLPSGTPCAECGRDPNARTTARELCTARAPMFGAVLALFMLLAAGSALLVHRWMEVDRLPPLHRAAAVGDVEEVERLLAGGTAADEPAGDLGTLPVWMHDGTALQWAAARGHGQAAQRLLDVGATPHGGMYARGPLIVAVERGHDAIAGAMLRRLARTDAPADVHQALPLASDAMRARMLEHFEWEDWRLQNAACSAIMGGDLACVELLVASGLDDVGDHPSNLLRHAVSTDTRAWDSPYRHDLGSTAHVLGLDLKGTETAAIRAFERAMLAGCLPAFDAMLDAYPMRRFRVELCSANDLANAAIGGGPRMVERLAELGASVNVVGRDSRNALSYAAMWGEAEAVAILVDAGVDPTQETNGVTPRQGLLHIAELAAADPDMYFLFPSLSDPQAVARILDLLEAAEARWRAGGGDADAAGTPGGP